MLDLEERKRSISRRVATAHVQSISNSNMRAVVDSRHGTGMLCAQPHGEKIAVLFDASLSLPFPDFSSSEQDKPACHLSRRQQGEEDAYRTGLLGTTKVKRLNVSSFVLYGWLGCITVCQHKRSSHGTTIWETKHVDVMQCYLGHVVAGVPDTITHEKRLILDFVR